MLALLSSWVSETSATTKAPRIQFGLASFYGYHDGLAGRKTATDHTSLDIRTAIAICPWPRPAWSRPDGARQHRRLGRHHGQGGAGDHHPAGEPRPHSGGPVDRETGRVGHQLQRVRYLAPEEQRQRVGAGGERPVVRSHAGEADEGGQADGGDARDVAEVDRALKMLRVVQEELRVGVAWQADDRAGADRRVEVPLGVDEAKPGWAGDRGTDIHARDVSRGDRRRGCSVARGDSAADSGLDRAGEVRHLSFSPFTANVEHFCPATCLVPGRRLGKTRLDYSTEIFLARQDERQEVRGNRVKEEVTDPLDADSIRLLSIRSKGHRPWTTH
jgi:hypothetical protein